VFQLGGEFARRAKKACRRPSVPRKEADAFSSPAINMPYNAS